MLRFLHFGHGVKYRTDEAKKEEIAGAETVRKVAA